MIEHGESQPQIEFFLTLLILGALKQGPCMCSAFKAINLHVLQKKNVTTIMFSGAP